MKLNRLETHDRYQHFIHDQSQVIFEGAEECLKKNPDSLKIQEKCAYVYIFAHPRTDDDGRNKRLLWQPRILRPKPQPNSYLFRAISHTDLMEICWIIPPKELWNQYTKGKICESDTVAWSINKFKFHREELENPYADDLTNDQAFKIFKEILNEQIQEKKYGFDT